MHNQEYIITKCPGNRDIVGRLMNLDRNGVARALSIGAGYCFINGFDTTSEAQRWPTTTTNHARTELTRVDVASPPPVPISYAERPGVKLDDGKIEPGLLFEDCARALASVLGVLVFGVKKYARDNWRKVPDAQTRYVAAAARHRMAVNAEGLRSKDAESGMYHIDHEICNLLFIRELMHKEDNANK